MHSADPSVIDQIFRGTLSGDTIAGEFGGSDGIMKWSWDANLISSTNCSPIQWSGNGHYYQLITTPKYWAEAKADAEALGGYLATITSQAEGDWIQNTFTPGGTLTGAPHCWLGGYQDKDDPAYSEPSGGWKWDKENEPWSYTNWLSGEPNDDDDSPGYYVGEHHLMTFASGKWFDKWEHRDPENYYVEWDSDPNENPVTQQPLPGYITDLLESLMISILPPKLMIWDQTQFVDLSDYLNNPLNSYDSDLPAVVIIHGWSLLAPFSIPDWMNEMADAIEQKSMKFCGVWNVIANNFGGQMTIDYSDGSNFEGTIYFYVKPTEISQIHGIINGDEIEFNRMHSADPSIVDQIFRGTLSGNSIIGEFGGSDGVMQWSWNSYMDVSCPSLPVNIFAWNWLSNAIGPLPPVEQVPSQSVLLYTALKNPFFADINKAAFIKFIGHSLGGGVATFTANYLETMNIDVMRLSLLDPPEDWRILGTARPPLRLYNLVNNLNNEEVIVDNYPSEFGRCYSLARNFWLKDVADGEGTSWKILGWLDDHGLSHAWYENTINPKKKKLPWTNPPDGKEGESLEEYFSHLPPNCFWNGVDDVGYSLNEELYNINKWLPVYSQFLPFKGYHAFLFEEEVLAFSTVSTPQPNYITLFSDHFDLLTSLWNVDGLAYILNGEMHIKTSSPTYLFAELDISEEADVMSFKYRFEDIADGDMLYLFINDKLLWYSTATEFTNEQMLDSGWIDILDYAGETVKLYLMLVEGTEEQAHAVIDDLVISDETGLENEIPIAEAGEDQTIYADLSGNAEVILNGIDSYDPDGDTLYYIWIKDEEVVSNEQSPTLSLPIGTHNITLIVRDMVGYSESDEVVINIVPPMDIQMKFTSQTLNVDSKGNYVKMHFTLPEGISIEDIDNTYPIMIQGLGVSSIEMNVFTNNEGLTKIEARFDRAEFCSFVGEVDSIEVTGIGKLTNGQYFYGRDTIRIKY
ncbi:MAG: hypothetical protein KAI43_13280 [Candidatus Aureabacteria bacterium]|nr:hypothetical protein [Candidatus Auribacterota bacterium]